MTGNEMFVNLFSSKLDSQGLYFQSAQLLIGALFFAVFCAFSSSRTEVIWLEALLHENSIYVPRVILHL